MRITELRNQSIEAQKHDLPGGEEMYRIVLTDKGTGDTIWLAFGSEVRDVLVRQLTGGIVLAGGRLPKMAVPKGRLH